MPSTDSLPLQFWGFFCFVYGFVHFKQIPESLPTLIG